MNHNSFCNINTTELLSISLILEESLKFGKFLINLCYTQLGNYYPISGKPSLFAGANYGYFTDEAQ